ATNATVSKRLAAQEPSDWELTGDPETWAEQMANDILPLARQAHTRLDFVNVNIETGESDIKSGQAKEKKRRSGKTYTTWAAGVVNSEIQKGGWRLAALLEATLQ